MSRDAHRGLPRPLAIGTAMLMVVATSAGAVTLPEQLELRYKLYYGKIHAGRTVKTLTREPGGEYFHRTWTQPEGLARMFTSTEWFEEGYFRVQDGAVRPMRFLKYRVGSSKPHRHGAEFDWTRGRIRFLSGREEPLTPDTLDEGSVLFAFMLRPPPESGERAVTITNGKKLLRYRYVAAGSETLETPLGPLRTRILKRLPESKAGDGQEDLTLWLAPEHGNIPVRIRALEGGREATMVLEAVQGPVIPKKTLN